MRDTTFCWRCSAEYQASSLQCPACCAANANIDLDSAAVEMDDESNISHDWQFHDDSFDHEFGVDRSWHWECERCGKHGGIRMNREVRKFLDMAESAASKGNCIKTRQALVEARMSLEDLVGAEL